MAELSSESLLASINALTATLSGQQEQITELKASAEKSVAELNTFYLMWAGTPLS